MKKTTRILALFLSAFLLLALTTLLCGAVSPDYKVSAAYENSIYYRNLQSLTLTGDGRADVMQIALSQLGYHEGNSDADLGGMNKAGSRNFVEYNVRFGKLDNGEGNGVSYGYMWCAAFVNWCLRQARVDEKTVGGMYVSCQRWLAWFQKEGTYRARTSNYIPTAGDLIFFKSDRTSAPSNHIGFVVYTEDGQVHTVEGNNEGVVGFHTYALNDTYIVGYGVPDYQTADNIAVDLRPQNNTPPGDYIVNKNRSVKLWADYQDKSDVLSQIPAYSTVHLYAVSQDYGYISYNDIYGWISLSLLYPLCHTANQTTVLYVTDSDHAPTVTVYGIGADAVVSQTAADGATPFAGWSTERNADSVLYAVGDPLPPETVLTLYPVYEPQQFTATFVGLDGEILQTVTDRAGATLNAPEVGSVERDGTYYLFDGWEPTVPDTLTETATYSARFVNATDTAVSDSAQSAERHSDTAVPTAADTSTGCTGSIGFLLSLLCLPAACLLVRRKES